MASTKVQKVGAEDLGNSANDERRVELLRDSRVGRKKIRGRMNIRWAQGRKTLGEWSAGIATGSTKKVDDKLLLLSVHIRDRY